MTTESKHMSEPKHAPGPWATMVTGYIDPGNRPVLGVYDAEGLKVAPWIYGLTPEIGQANARLIAAAPNLLAALVEAESEARNQLVRLQLSGEDDGPPATLWREKQAAWAATIIAAGYSLKRKAGQ